MSMSLPRFRAMVKLDGTAKPRSFVRWAIPGITWASSCLQEQTQPFRWGRPCRDCPRASIRRVPTKKSHQVEHVHVHAGGQAVVGMVAPSPVYRGAGVAAIWRNNPRQSRLPMHMSPRCRARTRAGTPCQSPAMPNGRCRMHGRKAPGAPKGNSHALRHGRYSAEAICRTAGTGGVVAHMKALAEQVEGDE